MRIAFASEENKGLESAMGYHFGRCPYYVFVDVEDKEIKKVETKTNPFLNRHEPGVVPQFIAREKADVIIAGGMGPRAVEWFNSLKIEPITAASGKIKDVLKDYLNGELKGANVCCDSEAK